jgi:hypothetical protein
MTEFFETRMGVRFYEHTVPSLVSAIERLAAAMERIADLQVRAGQPQQETSHDPEDSRAEENPPSR